MISKGSVIDSIKINKSCSKRNYGKYLNNQKLQSPKRVIELLSVQDFYYLYKRCDSYIVVNGVVKVILGSQYGSRHLVDGSLGFRSPPRRANSGLRSVFRDLCQAGQPGQSSPSSSTSHVFFFNVFFTVHILIISSLSIQAEEKNP